METNEHKDVEEYFNWVHKASFPHEHKDDNLDTQRYVTYLLRPSRSVIETTARVIDDEPDRSLTLFNKMHHFVETGKVEK